MNATANSSFPLSPDHCSVHSISNSIFTAFTLCYICLLPLFILVLCIGVQQWTSSAAARHSDIITYNVAALELVSISGTLVYSCAAFSHFQRTAKVGMFIFTISSGGQSMFHVLTCVERYMAVVHPVTYMKLKQAGGARIRNISIGSVWVWGLVTVVQRCLFGNEFLTITAYFLVTWCFVTVFFCCVSVLLVLRRSVSNRKKVDRSKQRAFHTMTAIMGALVLRFIGIPVRHTLFFMVTYTSCLLGSFAVWFNLPSSLVLPLLFLHRAGKLPGWKHNAGSG